jgi:penicillin-binding protein 1A
MVMDEQNQQKAIKLFWKIFAIPFILLFVLFVLIATGNFGYMPNFEELENPNTNLASEVISSDQELIGKYYKENRTIVQFDNLPQNLVNALISTEDARYYSHSGIDAKGLFRVLFKTIILNDKSSGGGSTITQQLAKNLFPRDTIRNRSAISKFSRLVLFKLKEWVIAVKLERNYTKDEILAMYFNTVDFGSQAFGIKSAARTFFDKSPDSLNIQEGAVLVGLVKGPSRFSPVRNPKRSLDRRNTVLEQMEKYGYLSRKECDSLKKLPIRLKYRVQSHNQGIGTYFREYLRITMTSKKPNKKNYSNMLKYKEDSVEWADNPLYGWCNKNLKADGKTPFDIYSDGLKIYTTINAKMQQYAEEAVREHMGGELQPEFYKQKKGAKNAPFDWKITEKEIGKIYYLAMIRSERYRVLKASGYDSMEIVKNFKTPLHMQVFSWNGPIDTVMTPLDSIRYYKFFLHAGLMSMEPQTGYVRAYVGDIDFFHFKFDNVMLARRQVGSTIKPFIYAMAMMPGGYSPCYQVPNIPVSFPMPHGQPEYTPKFSVLKGYEGKLVSLKMGLAYSLNQVSAWILKRYHPAEVVSLAKKMGVKSEIPEVYSICVGSPEIKLAEMVGAYGTFANKGVYVEPIFVTRIEDKNGNILATFKPKKQEAMSEGTAYRMIALMQGVVEMGTSARLRFKYLLTNQIAGKTGTTNDNSDGWFIGMVPNLVTGVWVGGEERSIRFPTGLYGQGAAMALPIWALYMQRIYKNPSLGISKGAFEMPEQMDGIEVDCKNFSQGETLIEEYINYEDEIY